MTEYVQPIAVTKEGSHEEIVYAVAAASAWAYLASQENPSWDLWLAGPFTKTVRRGTNTQFQVCEDQAVFTVQVGSAKAAAEAPRPASELGLPWSKMQVSGLEREREGWNFRPENSPFSIPVIYINPEVDMTTGKTAAQAAHGLFSWVLQQTELRLAVWEMEGAGFAITDDPIEWQHAIIADPDITIWDAGRTEIAPNTLTVVVLDSPVQPFQESP